MADVSSPDPVRPRLVLAGQAAVPQPETAPANRADAPSGRAAATASRAAPAAAPPEGLEAQLAAARLQLRERDETEQMHQTELLAMERDLAVKEAYVASLEREQDRLREEIDQVRDRATELFGDLERSEARIVELGAMVADIQRQASYRLSVRVVRVVRRTGPVFGLARRLVRRRRG